MSTHVEKLNNKKDSDLGKADQEKEIKDLKKEKKSEEDFSKKDQNKKESQKDEKQEPKENEKKEESPGVFSKLGNLLKGIFEGAKEIVTPNLSEHEESSQTKEAKSESKDEHTKSKSQKEEKPSHENKDQSEKHEANKYLVQTLSGKDSEEYNDKGRDRPAANLN